MNPEELHALVEYYVSQGMEPPPELLAMYEQTFGSAGAYERETRPDYYGNIPPAFSDSAVQEMTVGGGDLGIGTGPGAYAPWYAGWYNQTPGAVPGSDIHPTQGMGAMTSGEQTVMGGGGVMGRGDSDISAVIGNSRMPDTGFYYRGGTGGPDTGEAPGGFVDPGFRLQGQPEQKARAYQPDPAEVLRFIINERDREQGAAPAPAQHRVAMPSAVSYQSQPKAPAARGAAASRLLKR